MALSTSLLFSFLFGFGFMVNCANGATTSLTTQAFTTGLASTTDSITCPRPIFTNSYAIVLDPDKPTYTNNYDLLELTCEEGHKSYALPSFMYCNPDGTWSNDPSGGLCYAQCNTTELIDDDDIKALNETGGSPQTVFDHGTIANFECTDQGQFSGSDVATCDNGTLDSNSEPTCLAYCPINPQELGEGLYYDIADDPVMNETDTKYYRDDDVIIYRCSEGYEDLINCTEPGCSSTCDDGTWDPPDIPTCVVITTSPMTTRMITTDITGSLGTTTDPVLTTDDQDMTTMELTTAMSMSTTATSDKTTISTMIPTTGGPDSTTLLDSSTAPPRTTTGSPSSTTSIGSSTASPKVTTGAAPTTGSPDLTTMSPQQTTVTEPDRSTSVTTKPTEKPNTKRPTTPEKTEEPQTTPVTAIETTTKPTTKQPTEPSTTERPELGPEVWKVVVGVTVPIMSILIITIISLMCWQYRRLDKTSPTSTSSPMKMNTNPYEESTESDHGPRPESMRIINNNGTVQEVVLPWRNSRAENEFIFAPETQSNNNKGRQQMLPMVDYSHEYGSSSYEDEHGNIVNSFDNNTYHNHETGNTTEIDGRNGYF